MRNYITTHRVDDSWSALYAAQEQKFISIGNGKDGDCKEEAIFKMTNVEDNLLKHYMEVRNRGLLLNKGNVDVQGRPTISDPATNRPIYIGEGIIPQIERFASKYAYNKLSVDVLHTVLQVLNEKSEKPQDNKYVFVMNEKAYNDIQKTLGTYLAQYKCANSFMWSKKANGYVEVGAKYDSYMFAGNTITFVVDRSLSLEYGNEKGFAMCLNMNGDMERNIAPIQLFTLRGGEIITNRFNGVGGQNGLSSGEVASPVAASRLKLLA